MATHAIFSNSGEAVCCVRLDMVSAECPAIRPSSLLLGLFALGIPESDMARAGLVDPRLVC